jgi:transposase-like protein
MSNNKYLDSFKSSIAQGFRNLPQDFQDCFWSDVELRVKELIKDLLETALEYEVETIIGTKKYSRSSLKKCYRNGFRTRKKVLTSLGAIENLKKPRIRDIIYESKILGNYQRYCTKFDKAIFNFYLKGMSCRRIRDTFERVFNTYFSHNQVSEMLKKLQEKLDIWRKQNINDIYDALIMDGIWINVKTLPKLIRKTMKKLTKGVILAVMGLKKDGTKKIVGFKLCNSESQSNWEGLLNDLASRGLKLNENAILVHDGCEGLISAIDFVFPYAKTQHCVFHFIKGTIQHIDNKNNYNKVKKDLSAVYKQSKNQNQAIKNIKKFIKKWYYKEPKLIKYINKHFYNTIRYLEYEDKEWQAKIKTTNYLERTFREIGRKIKDVGVFPNIYSAERIVFLQIMELNYKFTGEVPFYVS